jgi:hypothetical protein
VDIHTLKRQGFTISEIGRRTNHDRKTIRANLNGEREPGASACPVGFVRCARRLRYRAVDRGSASMGSDAAGRVTFAEICRVVSGADQTDPGPAGCGRRASPARVTTRANVVIAHPPEEETQFDWIEMPDPPAQWGFGRNIAYVLVGSLAHSGVWRDMVPVDGRAARAGRHDDAAGPAWRTHEGLAVSTGCGPFDSATGDPTPQFAALCVAAPSSNWPRRSANRPVILSRDVVNGGGRRRSQRRCGKGTRARLRQVFVSHVNSVFPSEGMLCLQPDPAMPIVGCFDDDPRVYR